MTFSIDDLLRPEAFPHEVAHLRLCETLISWVVLTGSYAYKVKKPVRYDFLDASTRERRAALCREELRLNRHFAPELYVDIVPIVLVAGRARIGAAGMAIEYAVRMHEFDPAQQLDHSVQTGAVAVGDATAFGAQLARLHARAACATSTGPYGSMATLYRHVMDNFPPLRADADRESAGALDRLEAWLEGCLGELRPCIDERLRGGRVRECHGDLHAGNIVCWQGRWLAFDCLEFDPQLRWIDVLSDVAFLTMDLGRRQRQDLGCAFLSRYLEESGDYEGLRLLRLYSVYRALVRAKVEVLAAAAGEAGALACPLEAWLSFVLRLTRDGHPALVIMHGVSASGKSWISEALVPALRALRVRSDLERKRLSGVPLQAQRRVEVGTGDYAAAMTAATYARLLACSELIIEAGFPAVVDATFLDDAQRQAFRELAIRRGVPFLIVCCEAGEAQLRQRVLERAAAAADPSEATLDVLHSQLANRRPLHAEERECAVRLEIGAMPTQTMIDTVSAALMRRPPSGSTRMAD